VGQYEGINLRNIQDERVSNALTCDHFGYRCFGQGKILISWRYTTRATLAVRHNFGDKEGEKGVRALT
jgi:hypothetical protein